MHMLIYLYPELQAYHCQLHCLPLWVAWNIFLSPFLTQFYDSCIAVYFIQECWDDDISRL